MSLQYETLIFMVYTDPLTASLAKNPSAMNGFEKVFIVFAAAFALEEYTASKEHGWTSESLALLSCL